MRRFVIMKTTEKTFATKKIMPAVLAILLVALFVVMTGFGAFADTAVNEGVKPDDEAAVKSDDSVGTKAIAAGAVVCIVATAAAIAMGMVVSKASESIARQPEADSKIRSGMMLGLVFIETVVIYALIVAILIIFVL